MNPLLSLAPLTTDVEHVNAELTHVEPRLADTRRLCSRSQHVCLVRDVIWCADLAYVGEKVCRRIHEIELRAPIHDRWDDGVVP